MKNKLLYGILALVMGMFVTGCSDEDDYAISTTPLLTNQSVVTGSADVTPTSATLHGSVKGLEGQAASAYVTGFYYGDAADALTEKAGGTGGAKFTATIVGSVNQTIYYQAFVTLQGKLTYTGEVKSLVLTNAQATTGSASDVTASKAVLAGTLTDFPADATCGVILSPASDAEQVRAGVRVAAAQTGATYSVEVKGLVPATKYYYVAYLDMGEGVVYGQDVQSFTTEQHVFDVDNDLVDLGLSTKWAKYNVGATTESEIGGLFGFGDLTGFMASLDMADYASADIYKTDKDIAYKAFGGKVTMPTIADFEELFALCQKEWTEVDGVSGYKFTGPNGNSIFLPAAGARVGNTLTGAGSMGNYLSGSINATDPQFAMAYQFSNGVGRRITSPVYQALAIRPVSTAKNVPFVKELLNKTWEIDLTTDEKSQIFKGPSYCYGMDDSWATVSNNEPIIGDVWLWDVDFAGNKWMVGGDAKNCQGTMTFSQEDGVNKVKVSQYIAENNFAEAEGTFTIDEENKTLTLDIDILAPTNFTTGFVDNKKTDIKILSLTDNSLQLAVVRTDPTQDPCLLSINYVPQLKKYGFNTKLTCYGGNDEETPDAWNSAIISVPNGDEAVGTYTVTFETQYPRSEGKVYLLEIEKFAEVYPDAFVRIDAIKADGKEVKFDASKFFYGDIEENGNYRIELANIWGKGSNGANGLKDTPFQSGGGDTDSETALAFDNTFEVTFTVVSLTQNGAGTYTPNLVTVNPSWGGTWGYNQGAQLEVKYENFQYSLVNSTAFSIKYESDVHADGSIMTFVEVADLFTFFPGTHATLDKLYLDDEEVTGYDASKVVDTNDGGNYRLELWNCYGATKGDCAFGTAEGDVIKELGFTQSIQLDFTFQHLFNIPQW